MCTKTTLHVYFPQPSPGSGPAPLYPEVLEKLLGPKSGLIYKNHFLFHFCFSFLFFFERTDCVVFSFLSAFALAKPRGAGVYGWPGYRSVRSK